MAVPRVRDDGLADRPVLTFEAVTKARWPDVVRFFAGTHAGYCWCMSWRMSGPEFAACDAADRRDAMQAIIASGTPVGILGYLGTEPVAWCSVAPRDSFGRMATARTIAPPTAPQTWTIACIVVRAEHRGDNVGLRMVKAAVEYARAHGAELVEAFPAPQRKDAAGRLQPATSYRHMGFAANYRKAGFRAVSTAPGQRPKMELSLDRPGTA